MAVSGKKIKRIRRVFWIFIVIIIAAVATGISLFSNTYHLRLMNKPLLERTSSFRVSDTDASDPAGFTDLNPAGEDYTRIAENENLILFISTDYNGIAVYDKQSKQLWESRPDAHIIEEETSDSYKNNMKSLFTFTHIELTGSAMKTTVNTSYSAIVEKELQTERIFSGIRLKYNFTELNVKLAVDIVLDGKALIVSVPDNLIFENEEGVDKIAEVKAELGKEIEAIRKTFEAVKAAAAKKSDYSESRKKAIELKANAVIGVLVTLKDQAGIGEVKQTQLDQLYDYINEVLRFTEDIEEIRGQLEKIKDNSASITEKAMLLSKGKSNGIISLSMIPYFGAHGSESDGYVFYPEGSGSLSYFSVIHPAMSGVYNADIYGAHGDMSLPPSGNKDEDIKEDVTPNVNLNSANIPVYGIKHQNSAFTAIITKGDCDSSIQFNPVTSDRKTGNIFGSYYFRKSTTIVNSTGGHTYVYDSIRTKNDWETRYEFLSDHDADYSGMAIAYREYLDNTGKLSRSPLMDRNSVPVGTSFYMGVYSDQNALFNTYISMTKFSDIQSFLVRLRNEGIEDILVSAISWNKKSGLVIPPPVVPARKLGGVKGLRELADYADTNNILLAVDSSPTWASSNDISFAQSNISAVKAKSQMTRNYHEFRPINPVYIYNSFTDDYFDKLEKYGVNAVLFKGLNTLVYDYNKNAPCEREETAMIYNLLMKKTSERLGCSVTDFANQYLFDSLDWITSVPQYVKPHLFTDETVPFYQIVLHGSIAYTGTGNNHFHSEKRERLKEIEYGFLPFYFLTQEDTYELRNHGISGFYSTKLSDWEDDLIKTTQKYKEDFGDVWNKRMTYHKMISKTLTMTEYENGIRIYFNYGSQAQITDGIEIPAEDYLVVRNKRSQG